MNRFHWSILEIEIVTFLLNFSIENKVVKKLMWLNFKFLMNWLTNKPPDCYQQITKFYLKNTKHLIIIKYIRI